MGQVKGCRHQDRRIQRYREPARDLTPTEQAYMQELIQNMFGQFVKAVADGRGLKFEDVKAIANGKVWTGEQAASMKLIDGVGDFETVVADTAKMVGIKGEPTLVHPERDRRTLMDLLLEMFRSFFLDGKRCWSSRWAFITCGSRELPLD